MKSSKGTALITGASGGIGLEFARIFAREGYSLVLVARNTERLEQIAAEIKEAHNVSVMVCPKDLEDPKAPSEIVETLKKSGTQVDVLVNNAGFGDLGLFHEAPIEKLTGMIQVNIFALTLLSRLILPDMVKRKSGKILNVASTAAFQPGPLMAVYYATKAYVLSLSEALSNEVEGTGVNITALCPGPTFSGFQKQANMEDSRLVQNRFLVMDAKTVAEKGYQALTHGKRVVVTGSVNRLMTFSIRFTPRRMATAMVRKLQERVQSQ